MEATKLRTNKIITAHSEILHTLLWLTPHPRLLLTTFLPQITQAFLSSIFPHASFIPLPTECLFFAIFHIFIRLLPFSSFHLTFFPPSHFSFFILHVIAFPGIPVIYKIVIYIRASCNHHHHLLFPSHPSLFSSLHIPTPRYPSQNSCYIWKKATYISSCNALCSDHHHRHLSFPSLRGTLCKDRSSMQITRACVRASPPLVTPPPRASEITLLPTQEPPPSG